MRKASLFVIAAIILLPSALAQEKKIAKGEKFPEFHTDELFSDKPLTLADVRGKIVIIHFWATGNKESMTDLFTLEKAYTKYASKGLDIISISLDEKKIRARHLATERNIKWHMVAEGEGYDAEIAKNFGVTALPRCFLLDTEGVVVGVDLRGDELLTAIEEALKKTPPMELTDPEAVAKAKYESAIALFDAKEYADAADILELVAQRFPTTPSGKLAQQKINEMKGDPQLAAALSKARIDRETRKETRRAQRLLDMARSLAQSGNNAGARDYYNRVLRNFGGTKEAEKAEEELKKLPQ